MYLYGIGHAMADYCCSWTASAETAFPAGLSENRAVHLDAEQWTELLQRIRNNAPPSYSEKRESGGTVVNMLKTARRLGAEAAFCGTVGGTEKGVRDGDGLFIQKRLARQGVQARLFLANGATGRFLIARICCGSAVRTAAAASPSAACRLTEACFEQDRAARADAVLIEGMQLANKKLAGKIYAFCRTQKIPLVLAAATEYGAGLIRNDMGNISALPQLILFANSFEAKRLGDIQGKALVIITEGKEGAAAYLRGESVSCRPERLQQEMTPSPETTGAGDVFAGSFLYKWFESGRKENADNLYSCLAFADAQAQKSLEEPLCSIKDEDRRQP